MLDLKVAARLLPEVSKIHIVAVHNECKEILLLIDDKQNIDNQNFNEEPTITAIDLAEPHQKPFSFRWTEEAVTPLQLSHDVASYLYEPHAALMKAGAYKLLAMRYGVRALHQHTPLYTSDTLINDFSGHCYKIISVFQFNKNTIKDLHKTIPYANVAVHNFPLSANDLKKRLKIRDGSKNFLFGVTLHDEKRKLILCERI
jgi:hypothetical protein